MRAILRRVVWWNFSKRLLCCFVRVHVSHPYTLPLVPLGGTMLHHLLIWCPSIKPASCNKELLLCTPWIGGSSGMESRYRVRDDLNFSNFSSPLICLGRVFHSRGASTENEESNFDWNFALECLCIGGISAQSPLRPQMRKETPMSFGTTPCSILWRYSR